MLANRKSPDIGDRLLKLAARAASLALGSSPTPKVTRGECEVTESMQPSEPTVPGLPWPGSRKDPRLALAPAALADTVLDMLPVRDISPDPAAPRQSASHAGLLAQTLPEGMSAVPELPPPAGLVPAVVALRPRGDGRAGGRVPAGMRLAVARRLAVPPRLSDARRLAFALRLPVPPRFAVPWPSPAQWAAWRSAAAARAAVVRWIRRTAVRWIRWTRPEPHRPEPHRLELCRPEPPRHVSQRREVLWHELRRREAPRHQLHRHDPFRDELAQPGARSRAR